MYYNKPVIYKTRHHGWQLNGKFHFSLIFSSFIKEFQINPNIHGFLWASMNCQHHLLSSVTGKQKHTMLHMNSALWRLWKISLVAESFNGKELQLWSLLHAFLTDPPLCLEWGKNGYSYGLFWLANWCVKNYSLSLCIINDDHNYTTVLSKCIHSILSCRKPPRSHPWNLRGLMTHWLCLVRQTSPESKRKNLLSTPALTKGK